MDYLCRCFMRRRSREVDEVVDPDLLRSDRVARTKRLCPNVREDVPPDEGVISYLYECDQFLFNKISNFQSTFDTFTFTTIYFLKLLSDFEKNEVSKKMDFLDFLEFLEFSIF